MKNFCHQDGENAFEFVSVCAEHEHSLAEGWSVNDDYKLGMHKTCDLCEMVVQGLFPYRLEYFLNRGWLKD